MAAKKQPLKVALHGMDSRTTKIMVLFLHGPCRDAAIIVNPEDAEVSIFDADVPASKKLLEKHVEENLQKPVIILSLWDVEQEGVLHVKKPINTENMLLVLEQAKKLISTSAKKAVLRSPKSQMVEDKALDEHLMMPQMASAPQTPDVDSLDELGDWFDLGWSDF